MIWIWVIPFLIGMGAVFQAAMNRKIGYVWSLPSAVLLNSLVFCASSFLYYLTQAPGTGFKWATFRWWYLFPGLFGFLLVSGLPFAMERLGAFAVFIIFIGAQLMTSYFWDLFLDGASFDWRRAIGLVLVFVGACLVIIKR